LCTLFGKLLSSKIYTIKLPNLLLKNSVSRLGRDVTLGHGAMLHDATVKDYAVVGIMATLSNRSVVGQWAIIGEAALVSEDQEVQDESIAVGVPVKVIGKIQERHKKRWTEGKRRYREFTRRNKTGLKQTGEN
jgi:carbonic anhydrase/acetyltransferase-like protein (isoleucine patch superfamily)